MRVLKISELQEKPMDTATPIAGWTGGQVSRTRQAVIGDGQSDNFRCNVVNFRVGATTGLAQTDNGIGTRRIHGPSELDRCPGSMV